MKSIEARLESALKGGRGEPGEEEEERGGKVQEERKGGEGSGREGGRGVQWKEEKVVVTKLQRKPLVFGREVREDKMGEGGGGVGGGREGRDGRKEEDTMRVRMARSRSRPPER